MDVIRGYRITPEPTTSHDTYTCKRCGIQRTQHGSRKIADYCLDCRPEAIALGWITPKEEAA